MNDMKHHQRRLSLVILPIVALGLYGFLPAGQENNFGQVARMVASELPRQHLSRRTLDDQISRSMLDNYISSLDFDRVYFLDGDIDRFYQKADSLVKDLQNGNLDLAGEIFETLKERVRNRLQFTKTQLDKGFDFSLDETYRWKRKDAPWAANEQEWDELWRKRVKNEYLRRMIAREVQEETNENPTPEESIKEDKEEDASEEAPPEPDLSPEAFILDRYTQYMHIMDDSDAEWVIQKYLTAFAKAFDPHCDYLSPAAVEDFEIEMKLSLVGIGALLRPEDGTAKIVNLIPGGPAAKDKRENRLRPGDKIIAVAQGDDLPVSILHWPLYRAVRLIRGEKGSRVTLTVIPAADPTGSTTKTVDLIRDEVKLEEREVKSRVETRTGTDGQEIKVGIIVVPAFYADMAGKRFNPDYKSSSGDVAAILRKMREERMDSIVLDLRNNGGGSLIESVLMTGLFIKTGPVVLVRERRGISILPDNDPTIAYTGPLVVLVNRISASASEILAAALQDYGRAVIVGDSRTHGKGSVQSVFNPNKKENMGSLKVSSALFYRISGGSTQLKGVEPDIVIPSAFDFMDFGEDSLSNPLEWSTVQPVMYSPFDDLSGVIPKLTLRSETRRKEDERFQAYEALLRRIENMNTDVEISLNETIRRERAQAEKELLDIQNRLIDQADITATDGTPDLIAEEAIRIAADLVELSRPPAPEKNDGSYDDSRTANGSSTELLLDKP